MGLTPPLLNGDEPIRDAADLHEYYGIKTNEVPLGGAIEVDS